MEGFTESIASGDWTVDWGKLSATCNPLPVGQSVVCNTADWPFVPSNTEENPWLVPDRQPWVPEPSPWIQPGPVHPVQPSPWIDPAPFQPYTPSHPPAPPWINPEVSPPEPAPGGIAPYEFEPINGGDMAETVGQLLEMLAAGGLTVEQFAKLAESGDTEHIVAFLQALEKRRAEDDDFNVALDQEMMK